MKLYYERMIEETQHVSLCFRISDQVLTHNLPLMKYLHCKKLLLRKLQHTVDLSKRPLTQLHQWLEQSWPYNLPSLARPSLQSPLLFL